MIRRSLDGGPPPRTVTGLVAATVLTLTVSAAAPAGAAAPAAAGPVAQTCVGRTVTPSDDLQALVNADTTGATFCLKAGLYRGLTVAPRANQSFVGEPGVVLNGSRLLTGFTRPGGTGPWQIGGQTQQGQVWRDGPCRPDRPACQLPEELFVDDKLQTPVTSLAQVGPGRWFFDYAADTIHLGSDPTGAKVETSVVPYAFSTNRAAPAPNVTIANLVVEKYATPGHMNTIGSQYPSPGWTVRNNEVRLNHGGGIGLNGGRALDNHVHHNGQQGISGVGPNNLVQGNEIAFNNTAGYDPGNEAGAGKFSNTVGLVYRANHVHGNFGTGPWTDSNNTGALYENNVVEDNDGVGIMHEISQAATIRNNILRNNGRTGSYVYSANILISSSRDVTVSGNTVLVGPTSGTAAPPTSRMGIVVFQGARMTDCSGQPCPASNNTVRDNVIWYTSPLNYLGSGNGISGTGVLANTDRIRMSGNVFQRNLYAMPDCAQNRWYWVTPAGVSHSGNFTAWREQGQDVGAVCRSDG